MKRQIFLIITLSLFFTVKAFGDCTITLVSGPATQSVCINSAITSVVYNPGSGNNIVSCTPLPNGVTAIFTTGPDRVTISGTPTESGNFNYTLELSGGGGCTITGTITVNPLPQGSLSANGPFCASGAGRLTWTATAGSGPYIVVYNDGADDRTASPVNSGVPFDVYTTPVAGTTTYTLVSVTDVNCARTSGFTGSSAAIIINPLPDAGLVLGGTGSVCSGTGTNITVAFSQGGINYQLRNNADNTPVGSPIAGNGATINLPTGNLSASRTFNVLATNATTSCSVQLNETETVTINPLPQGSLSANGPFCTSGSGQLTWTATTGTGPYTVIYNDGTANRTATPVNSGVPFNVFSTPVTATTTYTLVSVADANCTRTGGFSGSSATITVHPQPQGSLFVNGPFCASGTGRIIWTATAGTGPFTIVYFDGVANRTKTNVSSGVPFDVNTNPVTSTTTYTLVSVTDLNCNRSSGFTSPSATLTINPLPSSITGTLTVCQSLTISLSSATSGGTWSSGDTGIATVNSAGVVTGVSGGVATIYYTLPTTCYVSAIVTVNPTPVVTTLPSASVCTGTSTNINLSSTVPSTYIWAIGTITGGIAGATPGSGSTIAQSLTNPDLTASGTVQYMVTPTSTTGSCEGLPYTITVLVRPLPRLTGASQSLTVCSGSSAGINLLGLLPNTTSTIAYEINNISQPTVTGVVSNASGISSFNTIPVTSANDGQLLRITGVFTTSYSPSCYQGFIQDLALSVDRPSDGGSVTAVLPVCSGEMPAELNLSGVTGYVVKWQKSSNAGFTSPIDIAFPTSPLTGIVIGPLTSNTWFRGVVKSGVCPEAYSSGTLVTVNPLPVPSITGPDKVNVGTSGHVYTTEPGMSAYTWTVSPGGSISMGSGTNSVTVTWNGSGDQFIRVNYKNSNNCTAASPVNYPVLVNAKPVAVAVTILGDPRSGLTLLGSYLYNDVDSDPEGTSVFQWYTNNTPSPAGALPVSSATAQSYTVRDADTTKYIGFSVMPYSISGASPGNMSISATWVGPVKNDPPKATSVSIAGTLFENSVLVGLYTYSDKEGDIESSSQFQWYSGNFATGPFTAIPGENTTTHLITNTEQGKYFRFSVIPRAATGKSTGLEVTVSTTGKVNSQPYADNVTISGNPAIDSILTATWSFHDPDNELPGASTFRWLRDGTDEISGARGTTYKATAQDEGKTLVFEVTPVSSSGFPATGNSVKSTPTGVVIDASGNVPAAQEVCIQGNRKKGALLTGKYFYDFYKGESGSRYRWLRNNVAIPGATGTIYTVTDADVAKGVEITFEVTPVSSNYIPKVGTPATSLPLSRIKLDRTTYSIADPPIMLDANVPGGFYSGKGVVGEYFDPEIADTIGSPHKIMYQVTLTNTVTVCPQQSYDSIFVFPINPYFIGLDTLYCFNDSPATVSVENIPDGAVDYKFYSPNNEIITSYVSPATVVIDPSKKGKDFVETLQFSFLYKGSPFTISKDFEIVYIEPAEIGNLKPGAEFCNNSEPFKLLPNLSASDGVGVFSGPVTGDVFDPSKGLGNTSVIFKYTNIRSGCFSSVSVPVTIHPAPKPAFKPVSTCIVTVNSDTTWFTNLTTTAEAITSWRWEFFDAGGSSTSADEDPGYQFKIGGQHRVIVEAKTIHQCSAIKDSTIDIGVKPLVNFSWRDECYNKDSSDYIWFYDASSSPSGIKSWKWDFFDGNPPVLNNTAKYLKTASGYLSVKLKVETNYKGCEDSLIRQIYIRPTITLASDGYFEDFEGGNGGWVKDYESKNSWAFGLPSRNVIDTAASGVNSWYTNYSLTGQTPENSSIISPCFDMDSVERPMIVMKLWRRFDRNRDGAALQYKIGDESGWHHVGNQDDGIKWYNSTLIQGEPGGKQVGWTAGSPNTKDVGWVEARHTLDELRGKSDVKFRIVYGSKDNPKENDGIAFDDIWIGERTRGVLLEHFTNANALSPDSQEANKLVNEISDSRGADIINIQYHTNFPGSDPYYSDNPGDASARFLFYGLSRAPFTITDGGTESSSFATVYDYMPDVELDTLEIINRSLINPYFEIIIKPVLAEGVLDINGRIRALTNLSVENATLYLAVTEKINTHHPIPGEAQFCNVFRKFIPDAGGISLKKTWSKNETFTIPNESWPVEKIPNSSEIEVIAFIQNNITKQIYQAESDTLNDIIVGIENIRGTEGKGFSIYPNPAEARLSIRFGEMLNSEADIYIYDFSGAIVRTYKAGSGETEFTIDDLDLKDGIYLIRITSGGVSFGFRKLIITGS